MGYEWRTKYYVVPVVLLQIGMGILMRDVPFWSWKMLLVAYVTSVVQSSQEGALIAGRPVTDECISLGSEWVRCV